MKKTKAKRERIGRMKRWSKPRPADTLNLSDIEQWAERTRNLGAKPVMRFATRPELERAGMAAPSPFYKAFMRAGEKPAGWGAVKVAQPWGKE